MTANLRKANLNGSEAEKGNANVSMSSIHDSHRFAAKFKPSGPTSNTKSIGKDLAGSMEVKPCWIG